MNALVKGTVAYLGAMGLWETLDREARFHRAEATAASAGKPLLLIGGPYGTAGWRKVFNIRAHGCGDYCLDLDARACGACPTVQADVRSIPFPDGYFGAAIASHVLEHLDSPDDAVAALNEMERVAGTVFVAGPSRLNPVAWAMRGHHLWVRQLGDGSVVIRRR